jgi:hypothetical protein
MPKSIPERRLNPAVAQQSIFQNNFSRVSNKNFPFSRLRAWGAVRRAAKDSGARQAFDGRCGRRALAGDEDRGS